MSTSDKTALVAGASRGLGLAMAEELHRRGWSVIATVRRPGVAALEALAGRPRNGSAASMEIETLDIADAASVRALGQRLQGRRLDLVIANAGITNSNVQDRMMEVADEEYARMLLTNALGPARLLEHLAASVPPSGVLAAMSSVLGSLRENVAGIWPAYASSKAALNMLLRDLAGGAGRGRAVVAMAPGWVRTEMGGPDAALSVAESIPLVIDELERIGWHPGLHYLNYDGRRLEW
ncbi:SDR family NAD(P)-dependent oxidoreductase [Rhizosaccharibacter radicis]|uniref:SDR family NAD(P)-dependent oxidoreductase n=1 Tax=Rhizosaccharibacter radicis TaxID=2782605 RepID=A0ABT1W1F2_9PROT|nr:SDR family NAD(P)-dependent oxidoreductase [Acetobacteraceae bacterium KSS12]